MNENNNSNEKIIQSTKSNNTNKVLIMIIALLVILIIAGGVYYAFIKKDNTNNSSNSNQQNNDNQNISVKKKLEVFAFNIILDIKGNAYLDLREENINSNDYAEITQLFNNAQTYSYNNKNEKLVKIDLQNVKDIQVLDFGNGGGKYIIFTDANDKVYALIDYEVESSGNITLLTDEKLNKVEEVVNDCDGDGTGGGGCSVFAIVKVNGEVEYVYFYDLFEKYKSSPFEEIKNNLKNYNPTYTISENKPKEISISPMADKYKFTLSSDGKVIVSKNNEKGVTISNISNAINIDYINDVVGRVFILLSNGDIYKYEIDEFDEKNYIATKISAIKNM